MEEKKSLKQKFKEFWNDKNKRDTTIALGGIAVTIISAYCLGYKNGEADTKQACLEALDIVRTGASSRGVCNGMNMASILAKHGYFGSNYADILSPSTGEVYGVRATVEDAVVEIVNTGMIDSDGYMIYDIKKLPSQK